MASSTIFLFRLWESRYWWGLKHVFRWKRVSVKITDKKPWVYFRVFGPLSDFIFLTSNNQAHRHGFPFVSILNSITLLVQQNAGEDLRMALMECDHPLHIIVGSSHDECSRYQCPQGNSIWSLKHIAGLQSWSWSHSLINHDDFDYHWPHC